MRNSYKVLVRKSQEKSSLGRPMHTWEDNIKIDLRESYKGMEWIHLAQDMVKWQALVNMIMNLWVP